MKFCPKPYQSIAIDFMLDHPRCALWAGMGMGKTSATLHVLNILSLIEPTKTLVLAPLRVATSVWPQEIQKWDQLSNLKISVMIGTKEERLAALGANADIYIINYNNLTWFINTCLELKIWKWTTIVADESTRLKSFRSRQGGQRARALSRAAWHPSVTRFIELTGTPSPNGLSDLWGQLWFLDRGQRLGTSYSAFMNRWFYKPFLNAFNFIPHTFTQKEIESSVKDLCLSLKAEDWFKVDELVHIDVPVTLPDKAFVLYKKMEKELFIKIEDKSVEALNAASKTIKCLQIANGAIYTEENKFEVIHNAKLDALDDLIEESSGAPILVAYHFKSDLARLQSRFPKGKVLGKDVTTLDEWNRGKIPVLFAHPASAGHGLNLQDGGNSIVFFGLWWDLEQYQQIIERIGPVRQAQAGHSRPVMVYTIRAEHTLDAVVIERRNGKKTVQDLLLEAAKGKL
jgi:SNF2 family DNA or RNA helicase